MALQMDMLRKKMAFLLQEMMGVGETFGWLVVHAYHAAGLQHLAQCRATWEDEVISLKLGRALVWHRVSLPTKPHPSAAQPTNQPIATTCAQRNTGPFSNPATAVCQQCFPPRRPTRV